MKYSLLSRFNIWLEQTDRNTDNIVRFEVQSTPWFNSLKTACLIQIQQKKMLQTEEKNRGRDLWREMKRRRRSEEATAQGTQKRKNKFQTWILNTREKEQRLKLKGVGCILGSTPEDFQVIASVRWCEYDGTWRWSSKAAPCCCLQDSILQIDASVPERFYVRGDVHVTSHNRNIQPGSMTCPCCCYCRLFIY